MGGGALLGLVSRPLKKSKEKMKRVRINLYVRGGDQWCPNDYGLFEESHLLSWLDLVIE